MGLRVLGRMRVKVSAYVGVTAEVLTAGYRSAKSLMISRCSWSQRGGAQ